MIFQTPTPDLTKSLDFYKKVRFDVIENDHGTFVTDQGAVIKINPDRIARGGVLLFKEDWSDEVKELNSLGTSYKTDSGYIFTDSTGAWIYLQNEAPPSLTIEASHKSILGNYMGLSLETLSMEKSAKVWEIFGFKPSMGGPDQGWMSLSNDQGQSVSLMKPNMCPHLFYNPSLTYFNSGKNPEIISKIREAQVPIKEEITVFNEKGEVDNVILSDPGGFGFFIFND